MIVPVHIPVRLLDQANSVGLSSIHHTHLIRLIAVCLYEYYASNHDVLDFYKKMSKDYINKVVSDRFYKYEFPKVKHNFNPKQNYVNKCSVESSIFQTNGDYSKKRKKPLFYRLNPNLMSGKTKKIMVDINPEDLNYNHLFPDVIKHYEESFRRIAVNEKALKFNLSNEFNVVYTGVCEDIYRISTTHNEASKYIDTDLSQMFVKEITVKGTTRPLNKRMNWVLKELESQRNKLSIDNMILSKEKRERLKIIVDGKRVLIDDYIQYLDKRERNGIRMIENHLRQIRDSVVKTTISLSNGRLNTNLTNFPGFLIKYLKLDGENLYSLDLKSSQVIILLNLMMDNNKLFDSIRHSKFPPLAEYLECFRSVDSRPYNVGEMLNYCIDEDIYKLIGSKAKITRNEAKPVMLKLLFSESDAPIEKKYDLSEEFPDFMCYLRELKVTFKKKYGNSKRSLALFLQMVESHLFVERIYIELSKKQILGFSKHDSLLVKNVPTDIEVAEQTMFDEFRRLGFRGEIKGEEYRCIEPKDMDFNNPELNMISMNPEEYFENMNNWDDFFGTYLEPNEEED